MEKLRLDKIVSATGLYSRREVKALVRQGRILADGRPVRSADEKFDPEETELLLDGERIDYQEYTYLMMNKPAGVLSATEDAKGRTVLSLLPPELQKRNLFPVGRLDKDTEGLLLLTNDGPWPMSCSRPGTMWIKSTMPGWKGKWTHRTAGPLQRV